ncbi:hypothetical protein EEB19_02925 [Gordonia sp. OPL2]|nr:hypothetical protein EEB19_02925 [Gordonia sp. OPL2]
MRSVVVGTAIAFIGGKNPGYIADHGVHGPIRDVLNNRSCETAGDDEDTHAPARGSVRRVTNR